MKCKFKCWWNGHSWSPLSTTSFTGSGCGPNPDERAYGVTIYRWLCCRCGVIRQEKLVGMNIQAKDHRPVVNDIELETLRKIAGL
jgi:hypothetical protein